MQGLSQVLNHRPMPSLGKMRTRAKELTASSPELFDTPEGSCGIQQSLTAALRDQVAQLLKDAPLSASFSLVNLV